MPRNTTRCARGRLVPAILSFLSLGLMAGCHHQPARVYSPPPPVLLPPSRPSNTAPNAGAPAIAGDAPIAPATTNPGMTSAADLAFVASHAPVWSETWHRKLVRATLRQAARRERTDLRPGRNDRGASHAAAEFADPGYQCADRTAGGAARDGSRPVSLPGRVLDLSKASAKERWACTSAGTGTVRIDVFAVPGTDRNRRTLVRADRRVQG